LLIISVTGRKTDRRYLAQGGTLAAWLADHPKEVGPNASTLGSAATGWVA
jgi:hypothetical protein